MKLRIVQQNDGFAVYDDDEPKDEHHYYGLLAYGFETKAEAEEWCAEMKCSVLE